jgi:hypothetical protein
VATPGVPSGRRGVFQRAAAEQGPQLFLYLVHRLEGARWSIQGEHVLESEGAPAAAQRR